MSEPNTTPTSLSQDRMNEFGVLSAGTGKIHTDPDYAASTPFGRTVVQGLYLAALVGKELTERSPEWAETGTLDLRFVSPVGADQEFAIAVEPDEAGSFRVELTTSDATAVKGTAAFDAD